jgi:hypothetical protein
MSHADHAAAHRATTDRAATLLRLRDLQLRVADGALVAEQARLEARTEAIAAAQAQVQAEWRTAHSHGLPCAAWDERQRAQLKAAALMCQEAQELVDRARAETVARRQDHDGAQRIWRTAQAAERAAETRREDARLVELAVASRHARPS